MSAMMDNPMMQALLNDETLMQNMIENSPQIRRLTESNPDMAAALRNPQVLRDAMQAMRNPAALAEMQRNADRALLTAENHPEGWRMLQSLHNAMGDPMDDIPSMNSSSQSQSTTTTPTPSQPESASPNASALPNPWASRGTKLFRGDFLFHPPSPPPSPSSLSILDFEPIY